MSWGGANRPKISTKIGRPINEDGADGDIQIKGTGLGAKLFAKWSGRWWDVPLSIDGVTKIGVTDSDYLSIDRDSVDIYTNSVKVASFGATTTVKDINLTGKIVITSTGTQNVCMGTGNADAGENNISIGVDAGKVLTTNGDENILIGTSAGLSLQEASENIAIGFEALKAYRGDSGVGRVIALGYRAGLLCVDSIQSIFIGALAGQNSSAGNSNVIIGYNAADTLETGMWNTVIGDVSDVSATNSRNQTVLGYGTDGVINNSVTLGNQNVTRVYASEDADAVLYADATINSSDKRMKENIEDINIGLDFINKLTPVTYTKRQPVNYDQSLKEKLRWYGKKDPRVLEDEEKGKIRPGFLAQDVLDVLKELSFSENNSIVHIDDTTTQYSMDYASIVVPLTKAVQELSAKLDTMQTEINELKQ